MLYSLRMFLFSLFVLAVGVSLYQSRKSSDISRVRSVEDYWAETGLGPAALEDLLQDATCVSSERYFLACTNAILNIANRYNMSLDRSGNLVPIEELVANDLTSEKSQMLPWQNFYSAEPEKASKISFLKIWKKLESQYVRSNQKAMIVGLGLNGFISVFKDPHTYFMPVEQFKEVVSKADNRSISLGLLLGIHNGSYVVKKVTEGSAAKKAGIQRGDVLLSINGKKVQGLVQARVSELLKGEVGDLNTLELLRGGEAQKFNLRRTEITVATVSTRVIDGIKPLGVIGINKFAKGVCGKVKDALEMVKKAQVRGLLLDLRDNPGGQLEEAACVTSLFVGPDKKIFEVRYLDPRKKSEFYLGEEEKIFDLPLAVLINSSSASASEIVAGALQDLKRAVLVGERTFGKGSFQEGEFWSQNKKIALFETKGFYYLPSGRSPQMKGLEPDIAVHFDHIKSLREADQFMNPLRAPETKVTRVAQSINVDDCLEVEGEENIEDVQLSKAQQVLFCPVVTAKVNL